MKKTKHEKEHPPKWNPGNSERGKIIGTTKHSKGHLAPRTPAERSNERALATRLPDLFSRLASTLAARLKLGRQEVPPSKVRWRGPCHRVRASCMPSRIMSRICSAPSGFFNIQQVPSHRRSCDFRHLHAIA